MAGGAVVAGGSGGNPLRTGFIKREYLWAFILVTSLFFLWGFAYGLLDVLNSHFQKVLDITKLESTGLQVAYFGIGYFAYSPVAGEILKRFGYKKTIISGLFLYSLGAILFWPVARSTLKVGFSKKGAFGGFVACTAVIACGLATLETAANSYVSTMPPTNVANFRLQFSQSFNGVASFTGPLIASKYFFSNGNEDNLTNVQWVYLGVSGMGLAVIVAFVLTKLPEVSEADLQAEAEALAEANHGEDVADVSFWRTKAPFGFVAQFMYVGAQVTIGSFFINYCIDDGYTKAKAAQLLSYALITFTVGRFIGTALLSIVSAPFLLMVYAVACCVCTVLISVIKGKVGVVFLIIIQFFESIMYPVIFVLGTTGLGKHTRRGAGLLVMGVSGGAVFPPIQGAVADAASTRISYWVALPAFVFIAVFAFFQWNAAGRSFKADSGEVVREIEASAGGTYPPASRSDAYEMDSKKHGPGGDDIDYVERL